MADNTDIRVQLESLTKDVEATQNIQGRLDTAIDKLTDVSTSIKVYVGSTRRKNPKTRTSRRHYL